jgi:GNAT superfamily N-acetyltransferase
MFTIFAARPSEQAAAFRLAYHYLAEEEKAPRVANALRLVSTKEVDPQGILVVQEGNQLHGAMVCLPLRGAGALVWPPYVLENPQRQAMENQLVQTGLSWLRSKGAKLVQAILHRVEVPLAEPLVRNGFTHVTRLCYLRHNLARPVANWIPFAVQTYSPANQNRFHEILLRTYEGTLDCPEVNGLRTIEEIIEGHQSQGIFKPEHWWLALEESQPVSVLLTVANPESQSWDLSYLGVVPEARGRGWGRRLIQLAIHEARSAGVSNLTVAVDARNHPAWNLYLALGFEPTGEREVCLHILNAPRL